MSSCSDRSWVRGFTRSLFVLSPQSSKSFRGLPTPEVEGMGLKIEDTLYTFSENFNYFSSHLECLSRNLSSILEHCFHRFSELHLKTFTVILMDRKMSFGQPLMFSLFNIYAVSSSAAFFLSLITLYSYLKNK